MICHSFETISIKSQRIGKGRDRKRITNLKKIVPFSYQFPILLRSHPFSILLKLSAQVEKRDISVAGRLIAHFPERLNPDQRIPDELAALGDLAKVSLCANDLEKVVLVNLKFLFTFLYIFTRICKTFHLCVDLLIKGRLSPSSNSDLFMIFFCIRPPRATSLSCPTYPPPSPSSLSALLSSRNIVNCVQSHNCIVVIAIIFGSVTSL